MLTKYGGRHNVPLMKTIEQTIRDALLEMKRQGVSINDVAKRTGTQQSSLSRFVRGERSITVSTLEKLWPFLVETNHQQQASGE